MEAGTVFELNGVNVRVLSVGHDYVRLSIVHPKRTKMRFVKGYELNMDGVKRRVHSVSASGRTGVVCRG